MPGKAWSSRTTPGAVKRTRLSTCASVMSSPRTPASQITFSTARVSMSSSSIWSRLFPRLRLSLTIELSVMRRVPSPSVSNEPPSATRGASTRGIPYFARRVSPTRASFSWVCLLPQPLKLRSTPTTAPSSSTKRGTVSRAQRSSTSSGMTSTWEPHARCAALSCKGPAIRTTSSYSATARAIRAMSSRTYGRSSAQTESRAGQDMKVRVWLSHSAPSRRSPSLPTSGPELFAAPAGPGSVGPQAEAPRTIAPIPAKERRAERREGTKVTWDSDRGLTGRRCGAAVGEGAHTGARCASREKGYLVRAANAADRTWRHGLHVRHCDTD